MKLQYPSLVGSVYRWCETNTTGQACVKPAVPCQKSECMGHSSEHGAAFHHAMWFCSNAGVTYPIDHLVKKVCVVCDNWTNVRAMFIGCPYQDEMPMCMDHSNVREVLTINHMLRRELSLQYRHHQTMQDVDRRLVQHLPVADHDKLSEDANAAAAT